MQLGCGKAVTAVVLCPKHEHSSNTLNTVLHTDFSRTPPLFFFVYTPIAQGSLFEQQKLWIFCLKYGV